jgi:ATP-dependent RNA helicase SUPV3L1/SUV3
LADLIRPAIAYRPGVTAGAAPSGAADNDGFVVTVAMTSLAGCSGDAFSSILRSLGYQSEKRAGEAITVPLLAEASREPVTPVTEAATLESEVAVQVEPADVAPVPVAETPVAEAPVEVMDSEAAPEGAAEPVASEVVVEPELIEIWHPHRHNRGQRHVRGGKGRPHQARGATPAEGQPAEGAEADAPKREDRRGKLQTPRRDGEKRPEGREGRPGGRPPQKGGGVGRPDRNDRRDNNRTFASTERPAPRERQPDPNSPFAKLLALKGELEAKKKD